MGTLRSKVIRLAYEKPHLRGHLLPLVKRAAVLPKSTIDTLLKDHHRELVRWAWENNVTREGGGDSEMWMEFDEIMADPISQAVISLGYESDASYEAYEDAQDEIAGHVLKKYGRADLDRLAGTVAKALRSLEWGPDYLKLYKWAKRDGATFVLVFPGALDEKNWSDRDYEHRGQMMAEAVDRAEDLAKKVGLRPATGSTGVPKIFEDHDLMREWVGTLNGQTLVVKAALAGEHKLPRPSQTFRL